MLTNILLITYSACLQLLSCANSREKTALAFIFLYAFKLVINILLGTGHRKLEGVYSLWLAWGGDTVSPCYQLQMSISPPHAKRQLYETLQPIQNCHCLAPRPCLIKVSKAYTCVNFILHNAFGNQNSQQRGAGGGEGFHLYFQNLHVPFSISFPSLWDRLQNAAVNSHVCAGRHIFIQWIRYQSTAISVFVDIRVSETLRLNGKT